MTKEKTVKVLVLGSGVGGLGAGSWLKEEEEESFVIVDGSSELPTNLHNGVHYLHSIPELPEEIDMDLRSITLTDGIVNRNGEISHTPNLHDSLDYSMKVREVQHPSSIMDVGKLTEVFMPSSNSMNYIVEGMAKYIGSDKFEFGWWLKEIWLNEKVANFENKDGDVMTIKYKHIISTIPLDKFLPMTGLEFVDAFNFEAKPVEITNYKIRDIVPNWLINLYFPDPITPVYRASILNNVASIESTRPLTDSEAKDEVPKLLRDFHIEGSSYSKYTWPTGKVISISQNDREKIVEALHEKDAYQIGRFGLWNRKLLVDSTINQSRGVVRFILTRSGFEALKEKLVK